MTAQPTPVRSEIIPVAMRDGVKLSVHVHRPDAPGRFAVLLSYTPYNKGPLNPDGARSLVEHGYAVVSFDIRGTGNSEGSNDSIYSDPERQDGYDMVEWAAAQPWSSGRVGMWGISFGAVVALQMARAAPPHLAAIIARSGTDDPYTEWTNPGGSPRPYMYMCYSPIMTVSNFSPPDPAEVGDRWEAIWAERLEHNVPWGVAFIEHLLDGPFWRDRSLRGHYERVRCPVFVVDGWADWYFTPLLRIFANVSVPKRALIGPWSHQWPDAAIPGPRIEWQSEALRWFDQWLKDTDTGVTREPPVTLFVSEHNPPASMRLMDRGAFRCETEWPPARAVATPFYLSAAGRLERAAPDDPAADTGDRLDSDPRAGLATGMHGGGPFNDNWAMPLDQRLDEGVSLVYSTDPLAESVDIIGQPRVMLHVAASARNALYAVKLCDVAPDGASALITKGWLNAAHRESHQEPTYLEPGQPVRLEFDLLACAHRVATGHRIRVMIAGADFMNVWPMPERTCSTVFRSAARPSCITLPLAPPRVPPLPPPAIRLLDSVPAAPKPPDRYVVTRDAINETQTLDYKVHYTPQWFNEATVTVSARDPARAVIRASSERSHTCAGQSIQVAATCVTESDATEFRHTVDLTVTVDGRPRFARSWSRTVPRQFM